MIRAWLTRRRTYAEGRVLAALVHGSPAGAYDLWYRTGLAPSRVTAALASLEGRGLITSHPETNTPAGMKPRRLYSVVKP